MVHDDFPYCEKDYLRLFAPKCTGCQDPIQGDFISALKGKWHRDCFGCTVSVIFLLCYFLCVCEIALCQCEYWLGSPFGSFLISRPYIFCILFISSRCVISASITLRTMLKTESRIARHTTRAVLLAVVFLALPLLLRSQRECEMELALSSERVPFLVLFAP
jgi:hypothetical protein